MTGHYHKICNSAICPVVCLGLIFYLGFGWEYLLSIPVGIYFSTFPDIDQVEKYVPHKWKLMKQLIKICIFLIGILSIATIIYCLIKRTHMIYALYGAIVLICYFLIYTYSKSKQGKFLFAHRGFTHTLIPPALIYLCFRACRGFINNPNMWINYGAKIVCILLIGMLIGILGHIFVDMECTTGCPILFPITKTAIHFGNAKTSDSKQKDGVHVSSKIWSYCTMIVFYLIGLFMVLHYFGVIQIGR